MTLLIACGAVRVAFPTAFIVLGLTKPQTAYMLTIPFAAVVLLVAVYDERDRRRRAARR